MRRRHQQHELVGADRHFEQPFLGGMKRQRAEIEAALLHFDGNLARRHAADVDGDVGIALAEARDERQQRVDRRLVGADEHAAAPHIAQLAHGRLGLLREPHQPLPVVLQHAAGFGQRPGLRRAIEQLLAELDFEPADRLAHRRLRAVHFRGGAREAALLGDGEKDLQGRQIHGRHYNMCLFFVNHYRFDFYYGRSPPLRP